MHIGDPVGTGSDAGPEEENNKVTLALTAGLSEGAKLRANRIFHLTPLGVEFEGTLTEEQVFEGFQLLRMADDCGHLWLADFIARARADYSEEFVNNVLVQLKFPLDEVQSAMATASLHRGVRHTSLTKEHYFVLAHTRFFPPRATDSRKLTEEEQLRWAKEAVLHKMTASHLQRCVEANKIIPKEEASRLNGRGSGVATPHGIRQAFDTWFRNVDENDPIHKWTVDRKRDLYEELKPVAKIVRDLEEELESEAGA